VVTTATVSPARSRGGLVNIEPAFHTVIGDGPNFAPDELNQLAVDLKPG
jgi:hypothetical protein